ncbi:MAG: hypothetical protein ACKO21_14695 [Nodosilinea sp.]
MTNPLLWLTLSLLLLTVSLTTVLLVAVPALQELGRAARTAEKLFDTLHRELPPTLEALRLTGRELAELGEDVETGVRRAAEVVRQVDEGLNLARQQVERVERGRRSVWVGVRAAWQVWRSQPQVSQQPRPKKLGHRRSNLPEWERRSTSSPPEPAPEKQSLLSPKAPSPGDHPGQGERPPSIPLVPPTDPWF